MKYLIPLLLALLMLGCSQTTEKISIPESGNRLPEWKTWAPTPPMGWNSYDAYHGAITEKQFREAVDVLAEKYLPLGYEYAVVDFCWFNPGPEGWDPDNWKTFLISQNWEGDSVFSPTMAMDEYGRLLPAGNRFPSAEGGKGFKPLADYVHSKGMKFGIHIIRGIPRQAVALDSPILGTDLHAGDVIHYLPKSWTNIMHIVDQNKEGAQAYYNSIFNLYAEWGVDYIKADDMMKPFYHAGEIEMMRKAIDQCGRPMLLSLSWGTSPLSYGDHLDANANLWRISGDFWDRWDKVVEMFELAANWASFAGEGTWPDADMIPIGKLCLSNYPNGRNLERLSRLSHDETQSLMSLWCIARSPLMWGGDPISTPGEYEKYLLNAEILEMNQHGVDPRQVWDRDNTRVWTSRVPGGAGIYVALFNLDEVEKEVAFDLFWERLTGTYAATDLWSGKKIDGVGQELSVSLPPHGSAVFKLVPAG